MRCHAAIISDDWANWAETFPADQVPDVNYQGTVETSFRVSISNRTPLNFYDALLVAVAIDAINDGHILGKEI